MSIPTATMTEILNRADRYCEHCGLTRPGGRFHVHHRLLRSAGGDDSPANLMILTPNHHNVAAGSVHQEVERSYRLGHILRRGEDPNLVPVRQALSEALDRHESGDCIVPERRLF